MTIISVGWFFPTEGEGSEANTRAPQNTEQVHDLDVDHPPEIVTRPPKFRHVPTDLEEN
ncbi:MAG: hypothetical protein US18_C0009G0017 [Parcubacteria group bacterium GW2011_GWB1_36_5]|nr:MAG: hypothetical protein US12_C0009G0020 [Parcubacteria group bacterium GW2011_GWA2_36_24]KKQ07738.1 MAG: hypothetical protein US18_C0009G0017 [Parcubacteria group bacterium GW2011_GWB1_36_5]